MDAAAAQTLFTQPSRSSGPVTVVVVEGLAGLLLLRDTDVRVLIAPNQPQRPSRRPVSQLPWTHLLGRCDMRAASAKSPEHTRPVRETEADADWSGINTQQAAAAEAFLGMTAADFAACQYHQALDADRRYRRRPRAPRRHRSRRHRCTRRRRRPPL
jgi:hypothetical protein